MMKSKRHFLLTGALVWTALLAACLPEDKDPGAVSDAGKLTGTYYASSLGNTALQIQNAIVGDPAWFTSLTSGTQLNLANLGISSAGTGINFKSNVCPNTGTTGVTQITWIDGIDPTTGKFSARGLGNDTGSILAGLNSRVASNQVGTYDGSSIKLSNGQNLAIPSSCSSISIPAGAPVLVFNIDRPAAPTSAMSRTEYRTIDCPISSGRKQLGKIVQSRVVTYNTDGSISAADWGGQSMTHCMDEVLVDVTQDTDMTTGASNLQNFAANILRDMLVAQLQAPCSSTTINSIPARMS
jgi:hypothetical protein